MNNNIIIKLIAITCCLILCLPSSDAQIQNAGPQRKPINTERRERKSANKLQLGGGKQQHRGKSLRDQLGVGSTEDNHDQPQRPGKVPTPPKSNTKGARQRTHQDPIVVEPVKNDMPVYYASVTRKNGWLIGVGKELTAEQASHYEISYRLSRKNKAGHWTFVEALDGYGNPTTPDFKISYLINLNFNTHLINYEWLEPLQSVCRWHFQTDESGENVIQEQALDEDNEIVFIFNLSKINDNEYLGYYADKWGSPIYLIGQEDNNCASRVLITRDKRGYDVLMKYIDDNGAPQTNTEGAFMTQREYDNAGLQTSGVSLNLLGMRMNDYYGNCGWRATYDKNGFIIEQHHIDTNGQPLQAKAKNEETDNVAGFRYNPDQYGRDTATVFIDYHGNHDTDFFGVHKIRNAYNDHGKCIFKAFYDLDGNLCPENNYYLEGGSFSQFVEYDSVTETINGAGNVAQYFYNYDKQGRLLMQEFKDKDKNYVTTMIDDEDFSFCCRQEIEYKSDDDDTQVRRTMYSPDKQNKKKLVKSYEYICDNYGNKTSTWFNTEWGLIKKIESVDSLNRPVLTAWYDSAGNPFNSYHYPKYTTTYDDKQGSKIEQWTDENGKPDYYSEYDRSYSKKVTITDNVNHAITEILYQGDTITNSFQNKIDPKSSDIISQHELTTYGKIARVGWQDSLYYERYFDRGFDGNQVAHHIVNEFGEPAYLRALNYSDESAYSIHDDINGRNYDEDCKEISSMEYFIMRLPRAYCIEITDTTAAAYQKGLRDGDIVISYGNWTASKNLKTEMNNFYLETILQANQSKNVTILRHHPSEKSSEILSYSLPTGKTSDLGFYPHKIYYTKKEVQRLVNTCKQYHFMLNQPAINDNDTTILLAIQKKGSLAETGFYYSPTNSNKDAGILLYAKSDNDIWSIRKKAKQDTDTSDETDAIIAEADAAAEAVDAAAEAVDEVAGVDEDLTAIVEDATIAETDDDNAHNYDDDTFNQSFPSAYYYSNRHLILTHDLIDLCSLEESSAYSYTRDRQGGLTIVPVKVNRSLLERIREFYALHSDEIPSDLGLEDYRAMNDPTITTEKIIGKWHLVAPINNILTANLTMALDKRNEAKLALRLNWQNNTEEIECLYQVGATWMLNGTCLEFELDNSNDSCEITKVEGKGLTEEQMTSLRNVATEIKTTLEYYSFSLNTIFNEDYFVVMVLNKMQMTVLDGDTERVFTKVK